MSLRIRAVSPEPSLLAHTSSESRGTFRQKARSQAPLNGWACPVKICHDGILEDTNSLDGAHIIHVLSFSSILYMYLGYIKLFPSQVFFSVKYAPPPGLRMVAGLILRASNILSWRLVMKFYGHSPLAADSSRAVISYW